MVQQFVCCILLCWCGRRLAFHRGIYNPRDQGLAGNVWRRDIKQGYASEKVLDETGQLKTLSPGTPEPKGTPQQYSQRREV
jgi:hypothetical protein